MSGFAASALAQALVIGQLAAGLVLGCTPFGCPYWGTSGYQRVCDWITLWFAIAAAAIRLAMPLVAARLSERSVVSVAMLMTALLFALYPVLYSPWAMGSFFCSVLLGLVLAGAAMIMSLLHQITPAHSHGQALGLRLMAINASSVVMPLLFGSVGGGCFCWYFGPLGCWWVLAHAAPGSLGAAQAQRI